MPGTMAVRQRTCRTAIPAGWPAKAAERATTPACNFQPQGALGSAPGCVVKCREPGATVGAVLTSLSHFRLTRRDQRLIVNFRVSARVVLAGPDPDVPLV